MDQLLRQWAMLRAIPRAPRRVNTAELHQRLQEQGYSVSRRTVERDLLYLSGSLFPLVCDDRSPPYGWYWERDAQPLDVPGMEPQTALAFQLAKQFLEPLMAPSTLAALRPHFTRAEHVLQHAPEPIARWPEKVRVLPRHFRLHPPECDEAVMEVVYQALLEERRFRVQYAPRKDPGRPREYVVNPLGLVVRDQVVYLLATLWHYPDVLQLVPHRMVAAELTEDAATPPEGFDLDGYLADEALDFPSEAPIHLHLRMDPEVAKHLAEMPLSEDQQWTPRDDGWVDVRTSLLDTQALRWWLLGFGPRVEVLAPAELRAGIAAELQQAAALYR